MAALNDHEEYKWMMNPLLFVPILAAAPVRVILILFLPKIENLWLNLAIILATYLFCFGATYLVLHSIRRHRKPPRRPGTPASGDADRTS